MKVLGGAVDGGLDRAFSEAPLHKVRDDYATSELHIMDQETWHT